MRRNAVSIGRLFGALLASFALAGCPAQATYQSTVTPIYAATNSGLYVFDGSNWTNYTNANTLGGLASDKASSVVVSGSGAGAAVFVGTDAGVSYSSGSAWKTWKIADGLGSDTINSLYLGSNLYAATSSGLSVNDYGTSWTNDSAIPAVNGVYRFGTYTYIAADAGLYVYNGTSQANTPFAPSSIISSSAKVTSILVDSNQDIVAGTDKGLAILYSGSSSFAAFNLPGNPNIHNVYLDAAGYLYAASDAGLFIIGSSQKLVLQGIPVYCVHVDGAGTVYAGTGSGLEVSKNGGSSWTTILSTPTRVNCVTATAPLYSF